MILSSVFALTTLTKSGTCHKNQDENAHHILSEI